MQETSFEKASHWLLDSGIQRENGAFSAWLDLDKGKNSFEYSEITGYGITSLVFLNSIKENGRLIERAKRASQWLGSHAISSEGAVLARNYMRWEQPNAKFSFEGGNCFAFDAGMVLNGLVNLYGLTKEQAVLDNALKVGNFLAEKMFENGKMHAVYNVKSGKVVDSWEKWSLQPGSYHAKASIGLLGLSEVGGEEKFAKTAISLCENALALQQPDGRFVTNQGNGSTHLHPHLYSAVGLLFAGEKVGERCFVDAAEKAVEWVFANQTENGGVDAFFSGKWNQSQRSDVLAQLLRLACALKAKGRLEGVADEKLTRLEERLLQFQHESRGFLYGKDLDLKERNCVNAWCTMFALQALHWHSTGKIDFAKII